MIGSEEGDLLQARMKRIRTRVDAKATELFDDAQRLLDWHHYVNRYPWTCVGVAAGLGFWFAPRRKATRVVKLADSSIDELVRKEALQLAPVLSPPQGWVMPLATAAGSILVRTASAYLARRFLGDPAAGSKPSNTEYQR